MVDINSLQLSNPLLNAGFQALSEGDWVTSHDCFQSAARTEETPEALEGLAMAAWWLEDAEAVFENRERAYRLYRKRADNLGAARMATWLAMDHSIFRGELAIANGWLQRAHRLLDGAEPGFEHCLLGIYEGHIALFDHNDISTAKTASADTIRLAHELNLVDLEVLALAMEGLALVCEGHVHEGMRRLDESTTAALSGELTDIDAIASTCCYLIYACERVRDFDRAAQWCDKVKQFCQRWAYQSLFAYCRVHYATVLMWRGDWSQAEAELLAARHALVATRPGWAPDAIARLGELRRRQGRLDEAAELFDEVASHPLALLGQSELALERGDVLVAADLVERFLRRVPRDALTEHVTGLELAVRVRISEGSLERARKTLAELEDAAHLIGTEPLRASANFARGLLATATGDVDSARRCLEDAVDLFERSGAPFEAAMARVELAHVLFRLERHQAAVDTVQEALRVFHRIHANRETERATNLLHEIESALSHDENHLSAPDTLTPREVEVLRLIARGYTNRQIADELFLSIRTVERHISTIYQKIGAQGRAARAIATAYAIEHSLTSNT